MSDLKKLEQLFTKGKINRREFLSRLSAMGATAAISPLLFSNRVQAATPKKGGQFRLGLAGGATSDTLDPATITDHMAMSINWQTRNCLVEVDYKGQAIPELAESWEASPTANQWVFKLRKDVEFHNGKSLSAKDVMYSINHHRGKTSKSAAKAIVAPITDMKADGKHTVVFNLAEGNADFPFIVSDYHLPIVPDGTSGRDFDKGVGTGAYVLESFEPGYQAKAKRNPNYWKKGRAHFDEVVTTGIADVTARATALNTGQIDAMNRFELKTIHLMQRVTHLQIINTVGHRHYSFPMLTDEKPYDNNDARLALKYAVDREHLVKQILRGYGTVGNDHPIAPNQKYFASSLPQRRYDPDKAKFHLKKAGLTDHTFKLHAADAAFEGAVDSATMYKEHAAKAGVKIEVVREPSDGYWSNVWMKKSWSACYWSGRATADWMFSTAYASDSPWNDTHWKHERFNKLLKEARAELDEARRSELYAECQKIVRDEAGVIIPAYANWIEAAAHHVKFENTAGNWEMDGNRAAERWWFDS